MLWRPSSTHLLLSLLLRFVIACPPSSPLLVETWRRGCRQDGSFQGTAGGTGAGADDRLWNCSATERLPGHIGLNISLKACRNMHASPRPPHACNRLKIQSRSSQCSIDKDNLGGRCGHYPDHRINDNMIAPRWGSCTASALGKLTFAGRLFMA